MTVKNAVGLVVSLDPFVSTLFTRLFIAFNRFERLPENLLVDSILTNLHIDPRNYPKYKVNKVSITWPTREEFILYIEYLIKEKELETQSETTKYEEIAEVIKIFTNEWEIHIKSNACHEHISGISWLTVYSPYHVLTRIIHKITLMLLKYAISFKRDEGGGSLKKVKFTIKKTKRSHQLFLEIKSLLEALLDQRVYMQRNILDYD